MYFLELWYNGVVRPIRGVLTAPRISQEAQRYVDTLDHDGVVLIPDLLSYDVFSAIRREYEAMLDVAVFKPTAPPGLECQARPHEANICLKINGSGGLDGLVREHFLNNRLLNEIAAGLLRRRIHGLNYARINAIKNVNPTYQDVSRGNEFHYDTPMTHLMMFYYLHDIDEKNGAFIYAKGSQRLSVARSWWVYRQIVLRNWYRLLHRDSYGLRLVTPKDAQFLKLQPTTMAGRENSLVLWDKKGFHKRGDFQDYQIRKMVEVSYDKSSPSNERG